MYFKIVIPLIYFKRCIYYFESRSDREKRDNKRDSISFFTPKWFQQSDLAQVKARRQEDHLGLPHGW